MLKKIINFGKYMIGSIIIAVPCILLIGYIFYFTGQHHYRPIPPVIEYGTINIEQKKFIYFELDIVATVKTYGTTIFVLGTKFNNDATLNISAVSKYGLLRNNDIKFITSPIILIPESYFIKKETIITTGIDRIPIFKIIKDDEMLKIIEFDNG